MTKYQIREFRGHATDEDAALERAHKAQSYIDTMTVDGWELHQFDTNLANSSATDRLFVVYVVVMAKYD